MEMEKGVTTPYRRKQTSRFVGCRGVAEVVQRRFSVSLFTKWLEFLYSISIMAVSICGSFRWRCPVWFVLLLVHRRRSQTLASIHDCNRAHHAHDRELISRKASSKK